MADVNTSSSDEWLIDQILAYGLGNPKLPKYTVLRLAIAKSLRMETPPDPEYGNPPAEKGSEYRLSVVTGFGKSRDEEGREQDFDDAIRALLSTYHDVNLFAPDNDLLYRKRLQAHVRRGLHEIRTTWTRSHDFMAYLQEELLAGLDTAGAESDEPAIAAENLRTALAEIGVRAEVRDWRRGPRLDRYLLRLDDLSHFDALKRGLPKLALSLGLQREGVFLQDTDEPKLIGLDIPRKPAAWQPVDAARLVDWAKSAGASGSALPVWLGYDVIGTDFAFDLAEAPHLLIAGTTGSGKSVTLHAILCSLLRTQSRNSLQLALIDPKQVELNHYAELPNLFAGKIAQQLSEASELLDALVEEMGERNRQLKDAGVRNLQEGLDNGRLHLPRIVVVVEELADLLMQSRELETPLVRLAQLARSTGIHLVLATQRPDASTFTGLLRSNAPSRIALRVQKATESRIILDESGAEKLLGKGDMLVKLGGMAQPARVHGAYVSEDDIRAACRAFT